MSDAITADIGAVEEEQEEEKEDEDGVDGSVERSEIFKSVEDEEELELSQHGGDAEDFHPFLYIGVRDLILPPQLQDATKTSEMEVVESVCLLLAYRPRLISIQQRRQDDSLVHLQLRAELEIVTIPNYALKVAEGLNDLRNSAAYFVVDFRAAGEGTAKIREVVHYLRLGFIPADLRRIVRRSCVQWWLVHDYWLFRFDDQTKFSQSAQKRSMLPCMSSFEMVLRAQPSTKRSLLTVVVGDAALANSNLKERPAQYGHPDSTLPLQSIDAESIDFSAESDVHSEAGYPQNGFEGKNFQSSDDSSRFRSSAAWGAKESHHQSYINFTILPCGCCAQVGRQSEDEPQVVSIAPSCANEGSVMHELGHVLGLFHEQSRPDRDEYVEVFEENIKPDDRIAFKKWSHDHIDSLGEPYDYNSIMHYGRRAAALPGKRETMRPTQCCPRPQIGQRIKPSLGDLRQVNKLYDCFLKCGGYLKADEGNFTSPGYPKSYPPNKECIWKIEVPIGYKVALTFDSFNWIRAIDEGNGVHVAYIDFKKAFDSVPHQRLLYKLSRIGVLRMQPRSKLSRSFVRLSYTIRIIAAFNDDVRTTTLDLTHAAKKSVSVIYAMISKPWVSQPDMR
nr:unnamed protein product [Spirometra erinaceieuropaei]